MTDGKWVTDEVAKIVRDKIFAGPFDSCPERATVNSLQTAPKPDGKVRIILKYSAPKKKVFGCVSSVGLFDRGARVIIWIALRESNFPFWLAIQHLGKTMAP